MEQPRAEAEPAPQQARQDAPLVSMDYEEGRFGTTKKKAEEYCADAFHRSAVHVAIDREAKVATFACSSPL
ncbi:MAG: hypothetical protein R3316_08320 [Rhodovibrionaceae bacterium]|nr:hypothetical protein [Rhodovibrionaceae bacterium]